jgi:mannose/cellobiose epimerase-like protein (N-acyl-D-glucosamine 2-epimerase family)
MHPADFKNTHFLLEHIQTTLAFYESNVDDPKGGGFQNFMDNGEVYDKTTRHLVSSTRFVFNYARADLQFGREVDLDRVKSGIKFLREEHLNKAKGGYYWMLNVEEGKTEVIDDTNHCYGLAFVILAYSWAIRAGVTEAKDYLQETWQLLEQYFWDAEFGLYKDEASGDFDQISAYRGQNANMHSCEALIAAYEATTDEKFLDRAFLLADNIVNRQAALSNGLIWEHYNEDWTIDWGYNKSDPKNLFKPWGFQPGHHTEWSKLLLILNQLRPNDWLVPRAKSLFDSVIDIAWDDEFGGLQYGFSPDSKICDAEKYFWVRAESFASAAYLAAATNDDHYWHWYEKIWQYAWQYMVDHQYGAWFRILSKNNQKLEQTKSPMGKTDYHTMGACYDVMRILKVYGK